MNLASYKNLSVERGRDSNKEGYLYDLSERLGLVAGATFAWQKVISGIKCVSIFTDICSAVVIILTLSKILVVMLEIFWNL